MIKTREPRFVSKLNISMVLQIRLFWLGKSNFADFVQNSGRLESALFGRDPEFFPSE